MAATAPGLLPVAVGVLLLGVAAVLTAAVPAPYVPPTVPELMERFGLPPALLPDTARRYLLHDDGSFQLFLDDGCEVEAGGYSVFYSIKVAGKVAPGRVTGLEGVRVRVLFVWVPVTGVEVSGGVVTLTVGPLRKSFPAVGFKSSPRCIAVSAAAAAADV